jgi:Tfp pilus assembly protein PilE
VVTFKANGEGDGVVDWKNASVLAADGLGTDVFSGSAKATYTVGAGTTPPPAPEPTPEEPVEELDTEPEEPASDATIAFGDPPRAPEVGSKTFLDPDIWYATTTGTFTWDLPFDVSDLFLEISTSSTNTPTTKIDPPVGEINLTSEMLKDGAQYLSMQFKNQVGLGAILNRKIMVDVTPPMMFAINVRAGNSTSSFPTLHFDAKDETSGIDYYELTIADREAVVVTPDEARLGYLLSALEDGTYTVRVKAYDKAGNITEASTPLLITAGWTKSIQDNKGSSFWGLFTLQNLLFVLLTLSVVALIAYIIYERKQFSKKESRLRKETREIQDQMEKIFSALRDEIYDQINAITKKPRLSRQEREAVENLSSALEVSETLIEKEITDVQKILR